MQNRDGRRAAAGNRLSGAESWTARLRHAEVALDDPRVIARVALRVAALALCDRPAAAPLVGSRALAAARCVGLFAGAFNPLTRAHIALAEAARVAGGLDAIAWTLAVVTVNKERVERATLPDRLAQLAAYCEDRPHDAVVAVNRGLYVEQARALREHLAPEARVSLVVGQDKVGQIFDARYYADRDAALAELFAEADLLVAPRAGHGPDELRQLLARPENARFATSVRAFALAPEYAAESSSQVRALAAVPRAKAPRGLVAPEGWALARLGAYASEDEPAGQGATYTTREAWEHALPGLSAPVLRTLPPLSTLVRRTQVLPAGAALRAWLEVREGGSSALSSLLG